MHPDITNQIQIIHITDLHFGDTHRFKPAISTDGDFPEDNAYPTLASKFLSDNSNLKKDAKTILCITGDFVDRGDVHEFKQAEIFLEEILSSEIFNHLTKDDVFIVPGNHDVNYTEDDLGIRFQQYMEFYNRFYRTNIKREEPNKCKLLHNLIDEKGIVVVCLNSSTYVRKGTQDEKRGRIGLEDLDLLIEELEEIAPQKLNESIRIALIHHHPVLIPSLAEPGRGYDAVHNSEKLIQILKKYGFHIILHGHKHNPHTFTEDILPAYSRTSNNPMMVVAGGSIGSKELPNHPDCINCYNRITIKWHPKGKQSRIRVETRGLRMYDENRNLLLPTRWSWEKMNIDDRHFFANKNTPTIVEDSTIKKYDVVAESEEIHRIQQYVKSRGNLPVVKVLPSLEEDQAYEVIVWIVQHRYGEEKPEKDIPVKVIYSAGKRFEVIEVNREQDRHFTAKLTYWGPMLIQCKLVFEDETEHFMHLYARMPNQY